MSEGGKEVSPRGAPSSDTDPPNRSRYSFLQDMENLLAAYNKSVSFNTNPAEMGSSESETESSQSDSSSSSSSNINGNKLQEAIELLYRHIDYVDVKSFTILEKCRLYRIRMELQEVHSKKGLSFSYTRLMKNSDSQNGLLFDEIITLAGDLRTDTAVISKLS